eukprot:m.50656 g.50656  ORF g.50656 m.50656 type:complete len:614 (+) comp11605_c0_seq2:138-1979(+)
MGNTEAKLIEQEIQNQKLPSRVEDARKEAPQQRAPKEIAPLAVADPAFQRKVPLSDPGIDFEVFARCASAGRMNEGDSEGAPAADALAASTAIDIESNLAAGAGAGTGAGAAGAAVNGGEEPNAAAANEAPEAAPGERARSHTWSSQQRTKRHAAQRAEQDIRAWVRMVDQDRERESNAATVTATGRASRSAHGSTPSPPASTPSRPRRGSAAASIGRHTTPANLEPMVAPSTSNDRSNMYGHFRWGYGGEGEDGEGGSARRRREILQARPTPPFATFEDFINEFQLPLKKPAAVMPAASPETSAMPVTSPSTPSSTRMRRSRSESAVVAAAGTGSARKRTQSTAGTASRSRAARGSEDLDAEPDEDEDDETFTSGRSERSGSVGRGPARRSGRVRRGSQLARAVAAEPSALQESPSQSLAQNATTAHPVHVAVTQAAPTPAPMRSASPTLMHGPAPPPTMPPRVGDTVLRGYPPLSAFDILGGLQSGSTVATSNATLGVYASGLSSHAAYPHGYGATPAMPPLGPSRHDYLHSLPPGQPVRQPPVTHTYGLGHTAPMPIPASAHGASQPLPLAVSDALDMLADPNLFGSPMGGLDMPVLSPDDVAKLFGSNP